MNYFKNIKYILLFTTAVLALYSCEKDDTIEVKDVDFAVGIEGYAVSFTNNTTDAATYKWDFGDGETSTEKSPVHVYPGKGKYVATLTATLNGGKTIEGSTIIRLSKSSPVKLDDNTLADWDTISTNVVTSGSGGGIVKMAKFDYDSESIYIYMETASKKSNGDIFDFYLDTDNDPGTGLLTNSIPEGGYDFLLEGQLLVGDLGMFKHVGPQNSFSFSQQSIPEYYQVGTVVEESGLLKFEMKISRGKVSGLTGKAMRLGIIITKSDWSATLGSMPDEGSAAIRISMAD